MAPKLWTISEMTLAKVEESHWPSDLNAPVAYRTYPVAATTAAPSRTHGLANRDMAESTAETVPATLARAPIANEVNVAAVPSAIIPPVPISAAAASPLCSLSQSRTATVALMTALIIPLMSGVTLCR